MNRGKINVTAIVVVSLVAVVAIVVLLPIMTATTEHSGSYPLNRCLSHLNQLTKATILYRIDFHAYPPWRNPDFFTTLHAKVLREESVYRCPSSSEEYASPEQFFANDPRVTDYECRNHPPDKNFSPALMLWEKKQFHEGCLNVVLGYFISDPKHKEWGGPWNMKAQWLPEEKFQELLQEARK
jgi:hypothetical protein